MAFHPILIAAAVSSARAYYSHICHYEIALIPACGVAEVAAEEDLLAKLFAVVSGLRGPSIRAYVYICIGSSSSSGELVLYADSKHTFSGTLPQSPEGLHGDIE